MITIYYIDTEHISETVLPKYFAMLPEFWQHELKTYRCFSDRKLGTFARLILIYHFGNFDSADYTHNRYGKPYIQGKEMFNISHSNNLVCAAFCKSEIGIDIEHIQQRPALTMLKDFCQAEQQFIRLENDPLYAFYYLWTRREALLKAVGTGWTTLKPQYNCIPASIGIDGSLWNLASFKLKDTYAGAVCVKSSGVDYTLTELTCNDLEKLGAVW